MLVKPYGFLQSAWAFWVFSHLPDWCCALALVVLLPIRGYQRFRDSQKERKPVKRGLFVKLLFQFQVVCHDHQMEHVRELLHKRIECEVTHQQWREKVKDSIYKTVHELYDLHSSFRYSVTILLAISTSALICYYVRAFLLQS